MKVVGTFSVTSFDPVRLDPAPPEVATGRPVGVAVLAKDYDGELSGRSVTIFTAAFDQASGSGTYVAMESFEGSLAGREGSFTFCHSATTSGSDRTAEFFTVVPGSATGALAGMVGTGSLAVTADGEHHVELEVTFG